MKIYFLPDWSANMMGSWETVRKLIRVFTEFAVVVVVVVVVVRTPLLKHSTIIRTALCDCLSISLNQ